MTHTSKSHKFVNLFAIFLIASFFGLLLFVVSGWSPFPSASAEVTPPSIEVPHKEWVASLKVDTIELPEMVIEATPVPHKPAVVQKNYQDLKMNFNPGAARKLRNIPSNNVGATLLESPTGLAGKEALAYDPFAREHNAEGHEAKATVESYRDSTGGKKGGVHFETENDLRR